MTKIHSSCECHFLAQTEIIHAGAANTCWTFYVLSALRYQAFCPFYINCTYDAISHVYTMHRLRVRSSEALQNRCWSYGSNLCLTCSECLLPHVFGSAGCPHVLPIKGCMVLLEPVQWNPMGEGKSREQRGGRNGNRGFVPYLKNADINIECVMRISRVFLWGPHFWVGYTLASAYMLMLYNLHGFQDTATYFLTAL
jgi:hypothetical protein